MKTADAVRLREQPRELSRLFGSIAGGYDFANHALSMGLDVYWRQVLVRSLHDVPPGMILDLAAGTFEVTRLLGRVYPERGILAVDCCLPMLRKGLPRLRKAGARAAGPLRVLPLAGNAFSLPLADCSVASVSLAFGLRNMQPRWQALAEIYRVLVPGGRLSVLEFGSSRPKSWLGLYNFYLSWVLPCLGGLLSGQRLAYEYLARSIADFPVAAELAREMGVAGFSRISYRRLSGGIVYLHSADKL